MTDIRDPEAAERLAHEAPDEYLRRREFLERAALTAGLASGMSLVLDSDTLVAEASRRQRRRAKLPAPRNMPIDTFVVLMMENRSFDHYLGWMPKADGRQAGLTFNDPQGKPHKTHRLTPDFQGCDFKDPDHSFEGGRKEFNHGKCDGWLKADNDDFALGYYQEGDVPFIPHAAKAFTTFDRFFCSILASTFPNREYMHAAQSYGKVDNSFPEVGFKDQGFPDTTIWAALKKRGVDGRYFFVDEPVTALWGKPAAQRSARVEEYYTRCKEGRLPPLSFVDPSFANEGGGTSGDEHPHGDIRAGQAYMSDVVHAFIDSPHWNRGALFIVYDEWGGFFDHVRPPRVPDIRQSRDLNKDFGQMGFRIPAVCISPWVRRGHVDHGVYGFESILKMIEYRFGAPPLTRRDAYAHNIAHAFDFRSKPRLTRPDLPDPAAIASAPCPSSPAGTSVAMRPKPHDMTLLRTSGYLDRLGFDYRPATAATMFREPTKVESLLQASA